MPELLHRAAVEDDRDPRREQPCCHERIRDPEDATETLHLVEDPLVEE